MAGCVSIDGVSMAAPSWRNLRQPMGRITLVVLRGGRGEVSTGIVLRRAAISGNPERAGTIWQPRQTKYRQGGSVKERWWWWWWRSGGGGRGGGSKEFIQNRARAWRYS